MENYKIVIPKSGHSRLWEVVTYSVKGGHTRWINCITAT